MVFSKDVDGRALDPVCRDAANPHRVSDQLLRWHFRQSVLANMRGEGEPVFKHDFPPGTDMMTEIREGPLAQERFELELSSRLRGLCEDTAQEALLVLIDLILSNLIHTMYLGDPLRRSANATRSQT